jgi:hypothetical protein
MRGSFRVLISLNVAVRFRRGDPDPVAGFNLGRNGQSALLVQ